MKDLEYFIYRTSEGNVITRRYLDEQGRRCTQFLAVMNDLATEDDAKMIVDALNARLHEEKKA